MLAVTHALSGLVTGMGAAQVATAWGQPLDPAAQALAAALTAGATLLSDMDTPMSTAARSLGPVTTGLARGINAFSHNIYKRTATPEDQRRRDGHRALTHTALVAVVLGAVVTLVGLLGETTLLVATFAVLVLLARRGLIGKTRRRGLWRLAGPVVVAIVVLWLFAHVLPSGGRGAVILGSTITLGMLVHDLGDALTDSGVPLLWPLKIKGRRWFRIRLPRRWALTTGGALEPVLVLVLFAIAVLQARALLG